MLSKNWKKVLKRAWSVRLNLLTTLLGVAEVAVQFIPEFYDIPRGVFAGLAIGTSLAANVARLIPQKNLENDNAD